MADRQKIANKAGKKRGKDKVTVSGREDKLTDKELDSQTQLQYTYLQKQTLRETQAKIYRYDLQRPMK